MRVIALTTKAGAHLQFFVVNDRKLALKIFDLFDAIVKDPFAGIGKPEPLKREI